MEPVLMSRDTLRRAVKSEQEVRGSLDKEYFENKTHRAHCLPLLEGSQKEVVSSLAWLVPLESS